MRQLALGLVLACVCLSGCRTGGGTNWARETRFEFSELPRSRASMIQQVFMDHGLRSEIIDNQGITSFRVHGILTTRQLGYVLGDIDNVLLAMSESSPLERATLRFGSLAAEGRIFSTIEVRVSQNARAFIADRSREAPWREVPVAEGRFKGPVNTTMMVAEQRGWVYYAAYREGGLTYGRVNVLTGETESRVNLPPGFPTPVAR